MRSCWALHLLLPAVWAQPEALRVGDGVTAPKMISQAVPKFTAAARRALVQGTVLIGYVVDKKGEPTDIEIISPLGFGLDEEAVRAVGSWRFVPATKEGKPIRVFSQAKINFEFPGSWTDTTSERRRTSFNIAVNNLSRGSERGKASAIASLEKLVKEKYPRAIALMGHYYVIGETPSRIPK